MNCDECKHTYEPKAAEWPMEKCSLYSEENPWRCGGEGSYTLCGGERLRRALGEDNFCSRPKAVLTDAEAIAYITGNGYEVKEYCATNYTTNQAFRVAMEMPNTLIKYIYGSSFNDALNAAARYVRNNR